MIESSRRGFITGLIAFAATAPAIVRAANIMPVKVIEPAFWQFADDGMVYGRSPTMDALPDLMAIHSMAIQRISREMAREVMFLPTYHGVAIREVDELDGWAGMRGAGS